jgi:hypothetical protein
MRCRLCVAAVLALLAFPAAAQATLSWSAPISIDQGGTFMLKSIACPSSTQCTAVDHEGQEVTFNPQSPGTPTPIAVDSGSVLTRVACPSSTQCTAVDEVGQEVTFNPQSPGSPTPTQIGGFRVPLSIACPSVTQCTAVDSVSEKYPGPPLGAQGHEITFNPQSPGTPTEAAITSRVSPTSVACPSSTQCTAVDASGGEVTFNPQSPGTPAPVTISEKRLTSVACPSSTQCTAVNETGGLVPSGAEVTFNPQSPGTPALVTISTKGLVSVACPSSTQCTAVASEAQQVTFNPQSPGTPEPTAIDSGNNITAVACPSATQCTAVDLKGHELTFNPQSPGTPAPVTIDRGAELNSVACPSSTQCTALEWRGGGEVTFNPQSPGSPTPVTIYSSYLYGVACPSSTQCTAVGQNGIEVTFNPQSPGTPTPVVIGGGNLGRVACPSSTQCTAVDNGGGELTFNPQSPGSPTPVTIFAGLPNASSAIACPSSTQCTVLQFDSEVTFNPQSPGTPTPVTIGSGLQGVACTSSIQCVAVGAFGLEVTFNPQSPGTTTSVPVDENYIEDYLWGVACPSSRQCIAVDQHGYEVTFNPTAPASSTVERIAGANDLLGISCSAATATVCAAVDDTGHAFVGTSTGTSPLTVTSVEPAAGPITGNSAVTIKGSGFLKGATVTIGSAATSVEVVSENEIRAHTAATAPGVDEVIVKDANGTSTAGPSYTYVAQGAWTSSVGSEGYDLADWDGAGDVSYLPNATLTLTQGSRYQWATNTTDPRALTDPGEQTRSAATYYDPKEINLQLHFSSAYTGTLHLYAVDWDSTSRRELIHVEGHNAIQTAALAGDFSQGAWVSFPVSVAAGGKVTIRATRVAGANAVLSGIFLGEGGSPPATTTSTSPEGAWTGALGSGGYDLAAWDGSTDLSDLPNASLSLLGGSRYEWASSTEDTRGLESPDGLTREAATYYDPNQIRLSLKFNAAFTGNLHLYAVDWDSTARREMISVNGQTATLSSSFNQGAWMSFPISVAAGETVSIVVDRTAGANAVLSGVFFGDGGSPPSIASVSEPQGSWVGAYGSAGYDLSAWSGASDLTSMPSATVSLAQGSRYEWASSSSDVRALQSPDKSTREPTTYYDPNQIRLSLTFNTAYGGNLRLYALDWDSNARRELITVNGQTATLSSSFNQGAWVSFPISVAAGETVSIVVDRTAGANAVLSGIFLG